MALNPYWSWLTVVQILLKGPRYVRVAVKMLFFSTATASANCSSAELFQVLNSLANPGCLHSETKFSIVFSEEFLSFATQLAPLSSQTKYRSILVYFGTVLQEDMSWGPPLLLKSQSSELRRLFCPVSMDQFLGCHPLTKDVLWGGCRQPAMTWACAPPSL